MPKKKINTSVKGDEKKFLYIRENENIIPINYNTLRHSEFDKILTWSTELASIGTKYIYTTPTILKTSNLYNSIPFHDKKFLVMVQSNLYNSQSGECYTLRRDIVAFLEKNCCQGFDLYGTGWDKFHIPNFRGAIAIPWLKKTMNCYRGYALDKREVMSKYRFSICFENSSNILDYVSEKIFDCFYSGCVPIYYGAPNISDYVPKQAFIDYRRFNDFDKLRQYISEMSETEYEGYRSAASDFLNSEEIRPYKIEQFCERCVNAFEAAVMS